MRIVGQISSNITFTGQYKMEGRGLNLLTLTGAGGLRISATRMTVTSEMYVVVREDKRAGTVELFLNDIKLKVRKEKLKVELENMLGGGLTGSVAREIITLLGEDFVRRTKEILSRRLNEFLKKELKNIIGWDRRSFL